MPFNSDDISGIVYVWIGENSDPEDAKLAEEVANWLYSVSLSETLPSISLNSFLTLHNKFFLTCHANNVSLLICLSLVVCSRNNIRYKLWWKERNQRTSFGLESEAKSHMTM